jgi:hypothetical protein
MRVVEEPFTTRDAILAILKPGHTPSEGPFRTLRTHKYASPGLRVDVRTALGRVVGSAHFYSSLNADAARAVRLGNVNLAKSFAERAQEIEHSDPAQVIQDAIHVTASALGIDPRFADAPVSLQRYLKLRGQSSWLNIDHDALTREWIVHSSAWLSRDEHGQLVEATMRLAQTAAETRSDLYVEPPSASTFFGLVRRMDVLAAEVQGDSETRLIPRDTLERQGLAIVGQAVALLCETLPAGGTLVLAMPAVTVEEDVPTLRGSPWDIEELDEGRVPASVIEPADHEWLERELAREPNAVPLAPLRRG